MGKKLTVETFAPEFDLQDTQGNAVRLADFRGQKSVVLVLTRGFV